MAIKGESLTVRYMAWDTVTNTPKTGDAEQHILKVIVDNNNPITPTNSPVEVSATNLPGIYQITLTASENDGISLTLGGKSNTSSDIVIIPTHWHNISTTGIGSITVNHNYGGADNLAYKTVTGIGIDNANVLAYLKTDYDAGKLSAEYIKGSTITDVNGRWQRNMQLDAGTYTFYFFKQGEYGPDTKEVEVS